MYKDKATTGVTAVASGGVGWAADWCWSSTERNHVYGWAHDIGEANQRNQTIGNKKGNFNVRVGWSF
jgi:hypothetical protein